LSDWLLWCLSGMERDGAGSCDFGLYRAFKAENMARMSHSDKELRGAANIVWSLV